METSDLEEVPLTEQEKIDIAEAWLAYVHALPPDREPDFNSSEGSGLFKATVNQILAAHDFEPFTAAFHWDTDEKLVVLARRLPTTRSMP